MQSAEYFIRREKFKTKKEEKRKIDEGKIPLFPSTYSSAAFYTRNLYRLTFDSGAVYFVRVVYRLLIPTLCVFFFSSSLLKASNFPFRSSLLL